MHKKDKKERANQQSAKIATTTAYEPISLHKPPTKSGVEDGHRLNEEGKQSDHSMSSSSESEDESDLNDKAHRSSRFRGRVLPSLGDELNHAKCIKDLSFYKLNWEEEHLQQYHRPNI